MSLTSGIYQVSSTQDGLFTSTEYLYVNPDGTNRLDKIISGHRMPTTLAGSEAVEPSEASQILARQGVTLSSTIQDYPSRVWFLKKVSSGVSVTTEYVHKYSNGNFIAKTLVTPIPAPGQTGQPTETRRTLSSSEAYDLLFSHLPAANFAAETF